MRPNATKGDHRQYNYRERSLRAKTYARILIPVTLFFVGTSVWKDPVMAAQVTEGLIEIRPIAETYLTGTPMENMLSLIPEAQVGSEPASEPAQSAGLPQIEPTLSDSPDSEES